MSARGSNSSNSRRRVAALALCLGMAVAGSGMDAVGPAAPPSAPGASVQPPRSRVITDQDVRHVPPRTGSTHAVPSVPATPGSAVTVSGLRIASSTPFVLTGSLRNTGTAPVSQLTLLGVALTAELEEMGRATVLLSGPLPPGAESSFQITIPTGNATPPTARVFVSGPVDRVTFDSGPQAPLPQP